MTWFAFGFAAVTATLISAVMFAMPALTRRTLALGVSVPAARVDDEVVHSAVSRYRGGVAVAWAVSVAAAGALARVAPEAGMTVPVFVALIGGGLAYVLARRPIAAAKRTEGWYEGVPVRLVADVSAGDAPRFHPPYLLAGIAVALLAITAGVGASVYQSLPDPVPIHWNLNGQANGWAAKSVWSVFGVLLIALAIDAAFFALSFATRLPLRGTASDDPELAARRAANQSRVLGSSLGWLMLALSLALSSSVLVGWIRPGDAILANATVFGTFAVILGVVVSMVVRLSRAQSGPVPQPAGTADDSRPDAPDDDRHWRSGLIYVNRADPAVFIPKRFGVGWTINLGSPGGIAVGVLLLLVIVAAVVLGVVAGSHS